MSKPAIATWLIPAALAAFGTCCREPTPIDRPPVTSRNAATAPTASQPAADQPEAAAQTQPEPLPPEHLTPVDRRLDSVAASLRGWLLVSQLCDDVEGGWATGDVDIGRNRIIIETQNVKEFAVVLRHLRVNWDQRVVLQINNQVMELTRKPRPIVRFHQTQTGGWDVAKQ